MASQNHQPAADDERLIEVDESDFRLLVSTVEDYAIFMLDPAGRVATWNRGAQKIKGYQAHEIIGQHFSVFYPEHRRADVDQELEIARRTGRFEEESWRVRKDGTMFWGNVVITTLRTPTGEVRGFAKVTRDLTERKKAEETKTELAREQAARLAAEAAEARIRASEERYRDLSKRLEVILRGVADGITAQDLSGKLVFANEAAARICGFSSPEELLAVTTDEVLARFELRDERGAIVDPTQLPGRRALRGDDPEPLLVRVRHRDTGAEWWSLIRSSAVRASDGTPNLVINIWHDVTFERREQESARFLAKASAALSESIERERTLQAFVQVLVPDLADWCVIHVLEDGEVRSAAVAHRDQSKVELAKEIQSRWPARADAARGVGAVIQAGAPELYPEITDELLALSAQNSEHLEVLRQLGLHSGLIVPIATHGRVFGAMTLISAESARRYDRRDLVLAEEVGRRAAIAIENARMYEDAQAAIKARDEFLSVASHELRTPLTSLELHVSSLVNAAERGRITDMRPEKIASRLQKAHEQVKWLTQLISDLLDTSRITNGQLSLEPRECDLATIVRDVCERFDGEARRARCALEVDVNGPIVGCWDRSRVDQIVTNLLSNALKYGPGRPVRISVTTSPDWARLVVRDQGIGIRPEDQGRVFERFERTDAARNFGGLGLGLWIVRQISIAHGGRATVESSPGEGSSFIVELPRAPSKGEESVQNRDGSG